MSVHHGKAPLFLLLLFGVSLAQQLSFAKAAPPSPLLQHSHLRAASPARLGHESKHDDQDTVSSILDIHQREEDEKETSLWAWEETAAILRKKHEQPTATLLVTNSSSWTTAPPPSTSVSELSNNGSDNTKHQRRRSNPLSYLDTASLETTAEQSLRFLQSPSSERSPYFSPLECNDPACQVNTTWTDQRYPVHRGTVIIPCGTCVWMDYESPDQTLELPHGLDVQGHLYIPDGYKLTIKTPFVIVQGLLEINSTAPIGKEPWIKFLINGNRTRVAFQPAHNNAFACPTAQGFPGECDIGFRAVAVAGGRVNIRGVPPATTTWTHLHDVVQVPTASEPRHYNFTKLPELDPNHINPYCRVHDPYINETFSNGAGDWTAGYGAHYTIHDRKFRVTKRKSDTEHAPTVDMLPFQDCLIPGQVYLFSARVRLWDPTQPRLVRTPCALDGETNCLQLHFSTRTYSGDRFGRKKHQETQLDDYKNYEWQNFHTKISFTEEELDPTNTFLLLQLRGPHERYNIDLDEVTLSLPHVSLVPDPDNVCGHNLIMNGDAEGSPIHPYPMEVSGGRLSIFTFTSTGNQAFRVGKRQRNEDALVYFMDAPNCITTGSRYRISARVYAMTNAFRVKIVIRYRIFFHDGTSRAYQAAKCDPSSFDWQHCEAKFAVVDDINPLEIDKVRFWFETTNAPTTDFLVDDFFVELAKPAKSGILVPAEGIDGHWDEGVEILITSHTTNMEDKQLRRLVHPPVPVGGGLVRLELDDYIVFPVTKQHDEGLFPVEVALLSRNIRFSAPKEELQEYRLLGGHFMILRTPNVDQHLEGALFENFGQQGELGRYPIHIHLCKNAHSVVTKNLVRSSNQRCVVIHGSHNTTISENVAFDTFGHCFITEDGGEFDNKFIRNLGSNTKTSTFIVREGETDNVNPSTFWSANPSNEWVGNVAAGSEANGYWLELLDFVRMPSALLETSFGVMPKRIPLTRFLDNVAHSNFRHGLKMYPHGLIPSVTAKFENFVSYKNRLDGLFFRNMENIIVKGGILADNRIQADFDEGDTVTMDGTRLIGSTLRYREIVQLQNLVRGGDHQDKVIGLEIHCFAKNTAKTGLQVRNVVFEGFDHTDSDFTALVQVDPKSDDVWSGVFDYWTTFEGISIKNNTIPFHFDFTEALESSYKGIYAVDLDSSMRPPSSDANGTSTAIADSPEMRAFMDPSKCSSIQDRGYLYCKNTCIRSVTFAVDPGQVDDIRLQIRREGDGTFYLYEGTQDFLIDDDLERHHRAKTNMERPRFFSAPLPTGRYNATFVHGTSHTPIWPTHVETMFEPALCNDTFGNDDVELTVPPPSNSECTELIRNGDLGQSAYSAPFWLQMESHLEVARGRGMKGSNALTDTDHESPLGSLGQYVDVRCLTTGQTYLIQAWVRFWEGGDFFLCDGGSPNCPDLRLMMFKQEDEAGVNITEDIIAVGTQYASPIRGSWNLLHGVVTVDERLEQATRAFVYVQRQRPGIKLFLDSMSMTRLENDCSELVFNGNFDEETTVFWEHFNGELNLRKIQGNNALVFKERSSSIAAITQRMRTGCMVKGARFLAKARFRLYDQESNNVECNPTFPVGGNACPRMRIRAFTNYGYGSQPTVGYPSSFVGNTDHGWTRDRWHTMTEVFSAGEVEEHAGQLILYINGPGEEYDIVIDDVSITPVEEDCSQLVLNGDAEEGDTARLWRLFLKSENASIVIINLGEGNQAFKVTGREHYNDGIAQFIDGRCMELGTQWKVEAQMKLVSKDSGEYVSCIPEEKNTLSSCPAVHVSTIKNGTRVDDGRYFMSNAGPWISDAFNKYETEFSVTNNIAWGEEYAVGFRNFNPDWDLIIDDISISPVVT